VPVQHLHSDRAQQRKTAHEREFHHGERAMKRGKITQLLLPSLSLLCLLHLTGCVLVPPTRVTTAIKTSSGLSQALAPPAQVPKTATRQQIEELYRAFAVPTDVPNLFWAIYLESKWYVNIYPAPPGRLWNSYNILALFNEDGSVKTFETVPNKKLAERFVSLQKQGVFPPLDLSQPLQVAARNTNPSLAWNIELSLVGLTFRHPSDQRQRTAQPLTPSFRQQLRDQSSESEIIFVPAAQVTSVAVEEKPMGEAFSNSDSCLQLTFSRKTTLGKTFEFSAEPRAALTLVRWLEQVRNPRL
jgi:hypothetical protein